MGDRLGRIGEDFLNHQVWNNSGKHPASCLVGAANLFPVFKGDLSG
jgi:hypothetical protein